MTPQQSNDLLREGVLTLVSKINIEGVPVGAIIGLFWAESDKTLQNWERIRKYAEDMARRVVDTERIRTLELRIKGLRGVALNYKNASFGTPEKGTHLISLIDQLTLFEGDFWDERNPEKMFPLFSAFGTLWIAALAELAYNYKNVFGIPDRDEARHIAAVKREIAKYTDAAQRSYDALYAWRFSLLQVTEGQTQSATQSTSEWKLVDAYDGYKKSHNAGDWGHSFHNPSGQRYVEGEFAIRAGQIQHTFVEQLQQTLAVAHLWRYLDPTVPLPASIHVVDNDAGPWGGDTRLGSAFQDAPAASARITGIRMRYGEVVDCLEVFYDGKSGGQHGNPDGGTPHEIALAADEYVVEVSGRCGDFIDSLVFTTSKGQAVGGGGTSGGKPFSTRGHSGWRNPKLFSVSGRSDSRRLTSLNLQWGHQRELPLYTASYKSGAPVLMGSRVKLVAHKGGAISAFVQQYSGRAAAQEYWPRHGSDAVALELHSQAVGAGKPFDANTAVQIRTTEAGVGDYNCLGKYSPSDVYYYTNSPGQREQMWTVIKMIPSDGPVLAGESVYLRNLEACNYLCPDGNEFITATSEPHAWVLQPTG
ncbi:jacalin-like lectin [Ramlibacter sp.]|uniref:jacalin-like lectin n=1 Tax=Ramlibacter sp. TaxID=1917967 RepID=UPI0017B8EEAA|nr:jacalin-like lectin [Ramlibacter sp.]MBA2672338.1 hypothetical protein [Ramlibacter sp.]